MKTYAAAPAVCLMGQVPARDCSARVGGGKDSFA